MLVGSRYIQSTDPGAVGFGYSWANSSTGILYERNPGNTAWVTAGDTTKTNLGFLPTTGGSVSTTFTGAHGLVALDGTVPFTNTPNVNGTMVCLMSDIEEAVKSVKLQLPSLVYSAQGAISTGTIGGNIVHWYDDGIGQEGNVSALPSVQIPIKVAKYYDGTPVKSSDIMTIGRVNSMGVGGGMARMSCSNEGFNVYCYCANRTNSTVYYSGKIGYMAIAINPNS